MWSIRIREGTGAGVGGGGEAEGDGDGARVILCGEVGRCVGAARRMGREGCEGRWLLVVRGDLMVDGRGVATAKAGGEGGMARSLSPGRPEADMINV